MSTSEAPIIPIGEQGLSDRISHIINEAHPGFALGMLIIPTALAVLAYWLGVTKLLFWTHIASGAVWFAMVLFFAWILGPTIDKVSDQTAGEFVVALVPKLTVFFIGSMTATVIAGTLLAETLYGFGEFWVQVALGYGWGLWVFGLVLPFRYIMKMYYELQTESPDTEFLETLEKREMVAGLIESVLMLGIIGVMTMIRLP